MIQEFHFAKVYDHLYSGQEYNALWYTLHLAIIIV